MKRFKYCFILIVVFFLVNNFAIAQDTTLVVTESGNIGIGTTNPSSKLHVSGGKLNVAYPDGQLTAADMDDVNGAFGRSGIAANHAADLYIRSFWGVMVDRLGGNANHSSYTNGLNPDGGSFALRYRTNATDFRTDFLVNSNGDVGIGTTSPNSKLTVAGTIESTSGGVIYPDGSIQTTAVDSEVLTFNDIDLSSIAPNSYSELTLMNPAREGCVVHSSLAQRDQPIPPGLVINAYHVEENTFKVYIHNLTNAAIDPPPMNISFSIINPPINAAPASNSMTAFKPKLIVIED